MKKFQWEGKSHGIQVFVSCELGSDDRWDERSIQILADEQGPCCVGIYKESRRGGLADERVVHEGYKVSAQQILQIQEKIEHQDKVFLEKEYAHLTKNSGIPLVFLPDKAEFPDFFL